MKILLDTHAALWWWGNDSKLSARAREVIADPANEVGFSAISGYEILQKARLGKLTIPNALAADLPTVVRDEGWLPVPVSLSDSTFAASIDHPHRDPFDRILAAQCAQGDFTLVTTDPAFVGFGTATIW